MDHEQFDGSILEPCAGNGAMAKVIEEYYPGRVTSSDLYDRGYGTPGIDVFSITKQYNNIITNPPYAIAGDVLEHCLDIATDKVCMLLRLAFCESQTRYKRFFRDRPPARVWVFPERVSMYPDGYPVKGGGTTSYGWFVFYPQQKVNMTELRWFPVGRKPKGY